MERDQELLVTSLATCKRKIARVAAKALLKDSWMVAHTDSFSAIKAGVTNALKLSHVKMLPYAYLPTLWIYFGGRF